MDRRQQERHPDRRRDHGEREERDRWCATRRLGDPTATFRAGETLRCPAVRRLSRGGQVVCGSSQGRAKPGTAAIVRERQASLGRLPYAGTDSTCHGCGSPIETFLLTAPSAAPTAAAAAAGA